jgi:hypothetical protein
VLPSRACLTNPCEADYTGSGGGERRDTEQRWLGEAN